jgi:hypothetical protein
MTLVGFEPTISADERPQIYALDRAAPGTCDVEIAALKKEFLEKTPSLPFDLFAKLGFPGLQVLEFTKSSALCKTKELL